MKLFQHLCFFIASMLMYLKMIQINKLTRILILPPRNLKFIRWRALGLRAARTVRSDALNAQLSPLVPWQKVYRGVASEATHL